MVMGHGEKLFAQGGIGGSWLQFFPQLAPTLEASSAHRSPATQSRGISPQERSHAGMGSIAPCHLHCLPAVEPGIGGAAVGPQCVCAWPPLVQARLLAGHL